MKFEFSDIGGLLLEEPKNIGALAVHICCAPDALHIVETLKKLLSCRIVGYFCNPNIYPQEEYKHRLEEAMRVGGALGAEICEGIYDYETFEERTKYLKNTREGGIRCAKCFDMRLEETARFARDKACDAFITTLTVSPHKNASLTNNIGKEYAQKYSVRYLASDFKKKDGFKKSVSASENFGLYRQRYCGCRYSLNETEQAK